MGHFGEHITPQGSPRPVIETPTSLALPLSLHLSIFFSVHHLWTVWSSFSTSDILGLVLCKRSFCSYSCELCSLALRGHHSLRTPVPECGPTAKSHCSPSGEVAQREGPCLPRLFPAPHRGPEHHMGGSDHPMATNHCSRSVTHTLCRFWSKYLISYCEPHFLLCEDVNPGSS